MVNIQFLIKLLPLVLPPLTFLDQINYRHQLTGIPTAKSFFPHLLFSYLFSSMYSNTFISYLISYNPPLSFASFCCSTCPSLGQWSPFKMLLIIFYEHIILYTLHYFLVQQNVPRSPYTLPAHTLKSVTSLESLGSR